MEQDGIRKIQQRIPAIESNTYVQSIATGYIMGVRNEHAYLIPRNNNRCNDRLVRAVNVKMINSQVRTNGYNIDEQDPGTIAVNDLDTNADTCYLGETFTVLKTTSRTADVYTYNT